MGMELKPINPSRRWCFVTNDQRKANNEIPLGANFEMSLVFYSITLNQNILFSAVCHGT